MEIMFGKEHYSVTNNFVYMYVVDSWADSEFSGLFNEMLNGTNSCAPYTDNLSYAYRLAGFTFNNF